MDYYVEGKPTDNTFTFLMGVIILLGATFGILYFATPYKDSVVAEPVVTKLNTGTELYTMLTSTVQNADLSAGERLDALAKLTTVNVEKYNYTGYSLNDSGVVQLTIKTADVSVASQADILQDLHKNIVTLGLSGVSHMGVRIENNVEGYYYEYTPSVQLRIKEKGLHGYDLFWVATGESEGYYPENFDANKDFTK